MNPFNPFTSFHIDPLNMSERDFHKLRKLIEDLKLPVTTFGGSFYVRFAREVDCEAFGQLLEEVLKQ